MNLTRFIFSLLLGLGIITGGCSKPRPVINGQNYQTFTDVIVEADSGYVFTMPELYYLINQSPLLHDGGILQTDRIAEFLDSIVVDTLTGFRADLVSLDEYPVYFRLCRQRFAERLLRGFFKYEVEDKIELDSLEIVKFYQERDDLFAVEEHINLFHILIGKWGLLGGEDSARYSAMSANDLDQAVREYAFSVRLVLDTFKVFDSAAVMYSHDQQVHMNRGSLGWTPKGLYPDPFDSIAFSMKIGEVSEPYLDNSGWHIIYVSDRIEAGTPKLDTMSYQLAKVTYRTHYKNRRASVLVDSLVDLIDITYNEAVLDTSVYEVDDWEWFGIVNGRDSLITLDMRSLEEIYRSKYVVDNTTRDQKKEMMRELAKRTIVLQAARDLKVDTIPEVVEAWNSLYHRYAKIVLESEWQISAFKPPEAAITAYYDNHLSGYMSKKPMTLQHIVVEDSLLAEFVRDQVMSGVDFLDLAEEHYLGNPPSVRKLADLGDISASDVPAVMYEAAGRTEVGGVANVYFSEPGFHVVKVVARRDSVTFSQARHEIVLTLKKQDARRIFERFRDGIFEQFHVRFPAKLSPIHLKPLDYRRD